MLRLRPVTSFGSMNFSMVVILPYCRECRGNHVYLNPQTLYHSNYTPTEPVLSQLQCLKGLSDERDQSLYLAVMSPLVFLVLTHC